MKTHNLCRGCRVMLSRKTIAAQRRRLAESGFAAEVIEAVTPRCSNCMGEELRRRRATDAAPHVR